MRFSQFMLSGVLFVGLVSCETSSDDLEKRLRDDPTRKAHRATLLALHVAHQSLAASQKVLNRVDAQCARDASGHVFTLSVIRKLGEFEEMSWRETRTSRVADTLAVEQEVTWRDTQGESSFRQAARVLGDRVYLKDDVADAWYERPIGFGERQVWEARGEGLTQVILDAVGGWQADGGIWVPGKDRLVCDSSVSAQVDTTWLERFESRGTLVDAQFEHRSDDKKRVLSARWTLESGRTLHVELTEEWSDDATPVVAPENVESVIRERSMSRARTLLDSLAAEGIVSPSDGAETK